MPAFFQKMEKLKPLYDATYKVLLFLCKLLLIGDILITAWAVAGRYLPFITDPHWSEEVVLTFMVYMAVLSATLAIRKRAHIRMTAFDPYLSPRAIKVSDLLADFRKIKEAFLTDIGTPNANTDKRERLITSEVESNNVETRTKIELWKESIERGIEQTKELFGPMDLAVSYRYDAPDMNKEPQEGREE